MRTEKLGMSADSPQLFSRWRRVGVCCAGVGQRVAHEGVQGAAAGMPELRGSGADLVKRNLRKLPRVAAPLEVRKLALYDLANALANVDAPHERAVVEACASGEMVGQLAALLIDADSAQGLEEVRTANRARGNFTLVSSSGTIRVGQKELRMDALETRLYALTCLVNLIYVGGGHLLYERGGTGLNMLAEALMDPPLAAGAAKDETGAGD